MLFDCIRMSLSLYTNCSYCMVYTQASDEEESSHLSVQVQNSLDDKQAESSRIHSNREDIGMYLEQRKFHVHNLVDTLVLYNLYLSSQLDTCTCWVQCNFLRVVECVRH